MQDERDQTLVQILSEAPTSGVQERLRRVADGGKVRHPQLIADAFHDSQQSRLLDPYLRPEALVAPQVLHVGIGRRSNSVGRIIPSQMGVDLTGAILHRVPVNE